MQESHLSYLIYAIVNALVGLSLFALAIAVIRQLLPFQLWKEIGENKNVALAVIVGAMSIGLAIIIAAAVH